MITTMTPSSLLGFTSIACAVHLFALIIHRLFFSRIAHIPGPRLAALTYFYQFYYDVYPYKGQFMFQCGKLHARFGPIIRIGPDEIHINDKSFYNEIYTSNARRRNKSTLWFWMVGLDGFSGRSTFTTMDHDLHRSRRAAFGQYFSKGKVLELQPRISKKVELLRENMMKWANTGELLDLYNAMSALTLEVITEYVFGRSVSVLDKPDLAGPYLDLARVGVKMHPLGRAFPTVMRNLLQMPHWTMSGNPTFVVGKRFEAQVDACAKSAFDDAVQDNTKIVTVLREMVESSALPAEEKTFARIKNDAAIFIGAGMETTGRTLAVTFYHILANPDIHKRLKEELRTVMPSSSSPIPSISELERIPFLTAVISEGLRLSHGTAGRLARIAPDEDLEYHGYKIPRGTTMSQSGYLLHTNSDTFPDPHEFHPERFLPNETYSGVDATEAHKNAVPFGRGTRMCVGLNLAWAELYLTIAVLLSTVQMELVDTTMKDVTVESEYFIGCLPAESKGIRVKVLGRL